MADTKISQLPAATTPLSGAEVVPLVQSGATVQTPVNDISLLTAATANTFTANQIISVTDNTNAALRVTQLGTGLALRIEDSANPDSSPFVVDASGNLGVGTASPIVPVDVVGQIRSLDGTVDLRMLPISASGAAIFGAISNHPLVIYTNNTERMRIDTSGNVLVTGAGGLGYGTGSGGTVTQLTSKATNVTLNKTNGSITTSNGALANNITVVFAVFNSTVAATDTIVLNIKSGGSGSTQSAYFCWVDAVAAGQFNVCIRNISGGTLSEALTLNFAVIKAVTA